MTDVTKKDSYFIFYETTYYCSSYAANIAGSGRLLPQGENIDITAIILRKAPNTGKVTAEEALLFKSYTQVDALTTGKITLKEALKIQNCYQMKLITSDYLTVDEAIKHFNDNNNALNYGCCELNVSKLDKENFATFLDTFCNIPFH